MWPDSLVFVLTMKKLLVLLGVLALFTPALASAAIAFDNKAGPVNGSSPSLTISNYLLAATTPILWVSCFRNASTDDITSVVWNGSEALTKAETSLLADNSQTTTLWYRIAPTSGTHDIVVSMSVSDTCYAISYTGASQTGISATNHFTHTAVTPYSQDFTTTLDNVWMLASVSDDAGRTHTSADANTTVRFTNGGNGYSLSDTNSAQTPTGTHTMSWNSSSGSPGWASAFVSFGPFTAAPTLATIANNFLVWGDW